MLSGLWQTDGQRDGLPAGTPAATSAWAPAGTPEMATELAAAQTPVLAQEQLRAPEKIALRQKVHSSQSAADHAQDEIPVRDEVLAQDAIPAQNGTINPIKSLSPLAQPFAGLSNLDEDFSDLSAWTLVDADEDGNNWATTGSFNSTSGLITPRQGSQMLISFSWNNAALTPDNWLISPELDVKAGDQLKFWMNSDNNFPAETISVYMGTGTDPANYEVQIFTETLTAGNWKEYTAEMGFFAGQTARVAFRHHDSTDQYFVVLDHVRQVENDPFTSWIRYEPTQAVVAPGESKDIVLTAETEGLEVGLYQRVLRIESNDNDNPIIDIPLRLNIIDGQLGGVVTTAVTNTTAYTASISGEVLSAGTGSVTDRGICVSTSQNPSLNDLCFTAGLDGDNGNGDGVGPFVATADGLSPFTSYFARSYVTTTVGVSYGSQLPFTTLPLIPEISLSKESFAWTATAGETLQDELVISNEGNTELLFAIVDRVSGTYLSGDNHIYPSDISDELTEDFTLAEGWTYFDADEDGNNWELLLPSDIGNEAQPIAGTNFAGSYSWDVTALTPDNWLVSPKIIVSEGDQLSFWVNSSSSFPAEKVSVYFSPVADSPDSFTEQIFTRRLTVGPWREYNVDLSPYAFSSGYIAFRHHDTSNQYYLILDQVQQISGQDEDSWLTFSQDQGEIGAESSVTIDITVDTEGLEPGVVERVIRVSSTDPNQPELFIPMTLTIEGGSGGSDTEVTESYIEGWNLVSQPVVADTVDGYDLFPTAFSNTIFSFDGSYAETDTLNAGIGYWVNLSEASDVTFVGGELGSAGVSLREGWNMIGSVSSEGDITDPDDVVLANTLYGFDGSYIEASSLVPGQGYWVAARDAGDVTLEMAEPGTVVAGDVAGTEVVGGTAGGAVAGRATRDGDTRGAGMRGAGTSGAGTSGTESHGDDAKTSSSSRWAEITGGASSIAFETTGGEVLQSLYLNAEIPETMHLLQRSLPPTPPEGAFDARFEGGFWLTDLRTAMVRLQQNGSPLTVRAEGSDILRIEFLRDGQNSGSHGSGSHGSGSHGSGSHGSGSHGSGSHGSNSHGSGGHGDTGNRSDVHELLPGQSVAVPSGVSGLMVSLFEQETTELPATVQLEQNYPNPFNPSTAIRFALPERARVNLEVFDMAGRRVAVLVNGSKEAGWHEIRFDASGLASGLYLYKLQTTAPSGGDSGVITRKMILLK